MSNVDINEGVKAWSKAYAENRINLRDQIPLKIPLCISIEPTNICNFKCRMCWQSTDEYQLGGGPFCNMDMKLFHHVIDDIQAMCEHANEKIKLIKLYSSGEPMLNKHLGEMLRIIRERDICRQMEVTSNCAFLTEELANDMLESDLDYLRVSIYSILDERHAYVTGQKSIMPNDIREKVSYLYNLRNKLGRQKPFICAKIIDTNGVENELFKKAYIDVSDEQIIDIPWNIAKLKECSLDKLYGKQGNAMHEKYQHTSMYKRRKTCRYPFTHMTIRSNGDVVVCCSDWSRDTLLGNIKTESLERIWNGKKLYAFRKMQLLTHGINHPLCSTCEIPLRDLAEDNIDDVSVDRLKYWE